MEQPLFYKSRRAFMPIIGKTRPDKAITITHTQITVFRCFSILYIFAGVMYLTWRLFFSLNMIHLSYACIVWFTEAALFAGAILRIINYWSPSDVLRKNPVHMLSEIRQLKESETDRPISIDIFIASINEEAFILEETISESKQLFYPHKDVSINIYLLDDGQRDGRHADKENIKLLSQKLGINYICRENNEGFKAGNLNNAIAQTSGDLFVILDADTRPFSRFLYHTTGYFTNHKLAWVQTPQWFKDITEETSLRNHLRMLAGKNTACIARIIEYFNPEAKAGQDIFCSKPNVFYDVVLRRRNKYNAVFSCGAASINRREAVMSLSLNNPDPAKGIPYRHHISEDIFNSLLMHADSTTKWESLYHADVECSMLSPQDLDSWVNQQKRYAMGSIDIGMSKNNPVCIAGLSLMQRILYFTVFYSYITPLLSIILFSIPIIFFFTQITPFSVSVNFILFFTAIHVLNIIVFKSGYLNISTKRFDQKFWSSFSYIFSSWITVIKTKKLPFTVTPKKRQNNKSHLKHIIPHLIIISLTITGIFLQITGLIKGFYTDWLASALFAILGLYHIYQLNTFIRAAFWKPENE